MKSAILLLCLVLVICFAPWLAAMVGAVLVILYVLVLADGAINDLARWLDRRSIRKACARGEHPQQYGDYEVERCDFDMTMRYYHVTRCRNCKKKLSKELYQTTSR